MIYIYIYIYNKIDIKSGTTSAVLTQFWRNGWHLWLLHVFWRRMDTPPTNKPQCRKGRGGGMTCCTSLRSRTFLRRWAVSNPCFKFPTGCRWMAWTHAARMPPRPKLKAKVFLHPWQRQVPRGRLILRRKILVVKWLWYRVFFVGVFVNRTRT